MNIFRQLRVYTQRLWGNVSLICDHLYEVVRSSWGVRVPTMTEIVRQSPNYLSDGAMAKAISFLPLHCIKAKVLSMLALHDLQRLLDFPETRRFARAGLKSRVYNLIGAFHLNPSKCLRMMRRTNTVLSGSAALKIIDARQWEVNDLDFYCPKDAAEEVLSWFENRDYHVTQTYESFYMPEASAGHHDHAAGEDPVIQFGANNCIETVFTLRNELYGQKINVIQSKSSSAVAPIAFFHSTLVMNFVTADTVVCGYPSLTLKGQGLVNFHAMPPLRAVRREVAGVSKYQDRGYSFLQGRDQDPTFDPVDRHRYRTWTDRYTLAMRFRTANSSKGVAELQAVGWKVSFREWYTEGGFIEFPAQFLGEEGARQVLYANWAPKPFRLQN